LSLADIAKLMGVSKATVSLALSGDPRVKKETRERIEEAARLAGYRAHGPARALARGRTGVIGYVPSHLETTLDPYNAGVLTGLARFLDRRQAEVMLLVDYRPGEVPRAITERFVDGAVVSMLPHPELTQILARFRIPAVAVDIGPVEDLDWVDVDDSGGIHQAVDHLVSLGHERIGYVNPVPWKGRRHVAVDRRIDAYREAMARRGLVAAADVDESPPIPGRVDLLLERDRATAVICFDDHVALEVIRELYARGRRIPEDMSVVGVDDLALVAEYAAPPLTTVKLPFEGMGEAAGELLLRRLESPGREFEHVILNEELVVRASTAPPRK